MVVTAVILAAGSAQRMGAEKLLLSLRGKPILAHVLGACAHLPTVAVASPTLVPWLQTQGVRAIPNPDPQRGMVHSLRLADAYIDPTHALAVLLGDKPLVTRSLVDRIVAAAAADDDVCFPERNGIGGHPVVLSPHARTLLGSIPDGDNLRDLRDAKTLRQHAVPTGDPGAFRDVDRPEDFIDLVRGNADAVE